MTSKRTASGRGLREAIRWTLMVAAYSTPLAVRAAELPVPCVSGVCGSSVPGFVTAGAATAASSGNTLTVQQSSSSATLNWSSFNISADGTVVFVQPSSTSTALNRIHQNDPSRIFGALNANGRVYLLNRNGVVFGKDAKVDVAGLLASSLDITPEALSNGLAGAGAAGAPALRQYSENGVDLPSGTVKVEQGAVIRTAEGGQVLMFAPEVSNQGTIEAPGGQVLLAAGSPVYLATSDDPGLRGLLVEVGTGGTVSNGRPGETQSSVGRIVAERGNVTLAGLAVNQFGRVSATTSVRANGSVRLQARDGGSVEAGSGALQATNGGQLTLGGGSLTEVTLQDSDETEVDISVQARSRIELQGKRIAADSGSSVVATGGVIKATARATPGSSTGSLDSLPLSGGFDDGSRIFLADGARFDVSGARAQLSVADNVVRAELRGDELANSPQQRDGPLRGQAVFVDRRATGTRSDGSTWVGTPVGDVSGQISLVGRTVQERNLAGGSVVLESQGDVVLAAGSKIDLSGGVAEYGAGWVSTTQLRGADGKLYDIRDARPDRQYTGIIASYTRTDERWGVTQTFPTFLDIGRYEAGYVEGKDAGTLQVTSPTAVIDGDVLGSVTVGRHQRNPAQVLAANAPYRPFDQVPLGGQLVLGASNSSTVDLITRNVVVGGGLTLPTLPGANGAFEPGSDDLPDDLVTRLRDDLFGSGRVTRLTVRSNGLVSIDAETTLELGGQGEIKIEAGAVEFAGDVVAPSGTVRLAALRTTNSTAPYIGIDVRDSATIDLAGVWVNESTSLNPVGSELPPLFIGGGQFDLTAQQGHARLAAGAAIDVSGGARARADGRIDAGKAGSIVVTAAPDLLFPIANLLVFDASITGYGLSQGGTLSVAGDQICLAQSSCQSGVRLNPAEFTAAGFGDITLRSTERGLTVQAGTSVELRQSNYQLTTNALDAPSGARLADLADVVVLADDRRRATNLTLVTSIPALASGALYTNESFAAAGQLIVEQGALIQGDIGSRISLRSNSAMTIAGSIIAPAGSISLTLDNTLPIGEVLDTQGIWLAAGATLSAPGSVRLQPNAENLRLGDVLDGGTVQIVAQRGFVAGNAGSTINVAGAQSAIDVPVMRGSSAATETRMIASDGGRIAITAADAIVLSSSLIAGPGLPSSSAAGGELVLTLNANDRQGPGERYALPYTERRLRVTENAALVSITPGTALPGAYLDLGEIADDQIAAAGFDSVRLSVASTVGVNDFGNAIVAPGTVELVGDIELGLRRQFVADASRLTGRGNSTIAAAYVRIGHSDPNYQQLPSFANGTEGSLLLAASLLEIVGDSIIEGFGTTHLSSAGDLRLRGVQSPGLGVVSGGLTTAGDLILSAEQIYATTLTDFVVAVGEAAGGRLRIERQGGERAAVLSAGSSLQLQAGTIEHAGVLRAPFGRIDLLANELHLLDGSLTSTSAEGALIPFGGLQAGNDWVYGLNGITLVVGDTVAVPTQRVRLQADIVDVATGAVVDISGGGDMLAYEFVPGPTGKIDVLSPSTNPGLFAVVPGLNLDYAPFDPQASAGTSLVPGDVVHLSSGVPGLPAGDYVLLPAAYALLPGAFTVSAASGYQDLAAGTVLQQLDGSRVISGYRAIANTEIADPRTSGFVVRTADQLAELARYDTAQASELVAASPQFYAGIRRPNDAGVLTILSGSTLELLGAITAVSSGGGRGAAVDIAAENLYVGQAAQADEGSVVLDPNQLAALGAESLLLGGQRAGERADAIDVVSSSLTIGEGAELLGPQLLFVARDSVKVEAGVTIGTQGDGAALDARFELDGDGAALGVSAGDSLTFVRANESGVTGALSLAAGSLLRAADGSVALDASRETSSAAELEMARGSLSIGASLINLGDVPDAAAGFTLDSGILSGIGLRELRLVSRSSVDIYGGVDLQLQDLVVDGAGWRSLTPDADARVSVLGSITLLNTADRVLADVVATSGSLELAAAQVEVGPGVQRFVGYEQVRLEASGVLLLSGDGGLQADGDLALAAPVIATARGAQSRISSDGLLSLEGSGIVDMNAAGLGGKVEFTGGSVDIGTSVQAASGVIVVRSTGDMTLSPGAQLNAAGLEQLFDGKPRYSSAGNVELLAQGNLNVAAGSRIDVSGAGSARAGTVTLVATNGSVAIDGTLSGSANDPADSGRLLIDAHSVGSVDALNETLNEGGFFGSRTLRQRGAGDLVVDAVTMRAMQVSVAADAGRVVVSGVIDAAGDNGGRVVLAGAQGVEVSGRIDADASSANGNGGRVELLASGGTLQLTQSGVIDVGAGSGASRSGFVHVRANRVSLLSLLDADTSNDGVRLDGTVQGAGRIDVEAYAVYDETSAQIVDGILRAENTAADVANPLYADAVGFMQQQAGLLAALGLEDDPRVRLLPGIEIRTAGDLQLGPAGNPALPAEVNWDLSGWRFGSRATPGVLTLRAGGDLVFNGSLSDGFVGVTGNTNSPAFRLDTVTPSSSWSYRLVAGADFAAGDPLAIDRDASHDVIIAAGAPSASTATTSGFRMVRTGDGSIDVAASGNFELGNRASVLYSAGRASETGALLGLGANGLGRRAYPVGGGDIRIVVDGDVLGQAAAGDADDFTQQLVTDWLWRVGKAPGASPAGFPTAWTVNFARFEQNVGALGGGNLTVLAGGDVVNFSASVPTVGIPSTGAAGTSTLTVAGGGDLTIRAAGDVLGGSYFVGRGAGSIESLGDVAATFNPRAARDLSPVLALADGSWRVSALGSLGIETVVNPTLLPQGRSQGPSTSNLATFATYEPSSAVSLESVSGDVTLANSVIRLVDWLSATMPLESTEQQVALYVYAPTLRSVSFSGNFAFDNQISLFPAAGSTVEILASENVTRLNPEAPARLLQSDADVALLPSVYAPQDTGALIAAALGPSGISSPFAHASVPIHANETTTALIVARTGDITFETPQGSLAGNTSLLSFAMPVRIVAGGNIVDLPVSIQHADSGDISTIEAGGDLRYSISRTPNGAITSNSLGIDIAGPGSLQIVSGGDVDLQTSRGITSIGNLGNLALPDVGASVSVLAGLQGVRPAYDDMTTRYLDVSFGPGATNDRRAYVEAVTGETNLTEDQVETRFEQLAQYRAQLTDFVEQRSGMSNLSEEQALTLFRAYEAAEQRELLDRVFVSELRLSGRDAAATGSQDFTRGFAALQTLYPGSNPDPEQSEVNPYDGDIALYFSRIYSLGNGGDILLFAPGGEVNVGLASPPQSFGLTKRASQLGMVIRGPGDIYSVSFGDLQVNESRVFATDGGDILVWSTRGDIDAGRGAKTAISAPPPTITFDPNGSPIITFPSTLTGSGIQTLSTSPGVEPGDVDLFAPRGVINAGDAGIVAGNLTVAATAVIGADNIQFGGVAVGVPVDAGGLGATLAGAANAATSASSTATEGLQAEGGSNQASEVAEGDDALSWLDVFVVGLGDESCDPKDLECLRRQQKK